MRGELSRQVGAISFFFGNRQLLFVRKNFSRAPRAVAERGEKKLLKIGLKNVSRVPSRSRKSDDSCQNLVCHSNIL